MWGPRLWMSVDIRAWWVDASLVSLYQPCCICPCHCWRCMERRGHVCPRCWSMLHASTACAHVPHAALQIKASTSSHCLFTAHRFTFSPTSHTMPLLLPDDGKPRRQRLPDQWLATVVEYEGLCVSDYRFYTQRLNTCYPPPHLTFDSSGITMIQLVFLVEH
jgi:hypothetical protein